MKSVFFFPFGLQCWAEYTTPRSSYAATDSALMSDQCGVGAAVFALLKGTFTVCVFISSHRTVHTYSPLAKQATLQSQASLAFKLPPQPLKRHEGFEMQTVASLPPAHKHTAHYNSWWHVQMFPIHQEMLWMAGPEERWRERENT